MSIRLLKPPADSFPEVSDRRRRFPIGLLVCGVILIVAAFFVRRELSRDEDEMIRNAVYYCPKCSEFHGGNFVSRFDD